MDGELEKLGERIAEQAAHFDAAMHRLLSDLHEFDERGGWHLQGASSCAHWLAWRVGWDLVTARDRVRVARKLPAFPAIDDALRRGEVSYSKVRAVLRVATPANAELLLEYARLMPASQLEKLTRKYAHVQRHGQAPHPLDDQYRRYVRRRDTEDGMVKIEAVLHPEEAEFVWTMLDHATTQLARGTGQPAADASAESRNVAPPQTRTVTRQSPDAGSVDPAVEPAHPDRRWSDVGVASSTSSMGDGAHGASAESCEVPQPHRAEVTLQSPDAAAGGGRGIAQTVCAGRGCSDLANRSPVPVADGGTHGASAESCEVARSQTRTAEVTLQSPETAAGGGSGIEQPVCACRRGSDLADCSPVPIADDGTYGASAGSCEVTQRQTRGAEVTLQFPDAAAGGRDCIEQSASISRGCSDLVPIAGDGTLGASAESCEVAQPRGGAVTLQSPDAAAPGGGCIEQTARISHGCSDLADCPAPIFGTHDASAESCETAQPRARWTAARAAIATSGSEPPMNTATEPAVRPWARVLPPTAADYAGGLAESAQAGDGCLDAEAPSQSAVVVSWNGDSAESRRVVRAPVPGRPASVLQQREDAVKRAFNRADGLVSLAQGYLRGDRPNRSPLEIVLTIPQASLRVEGGAVDPLEVGEIGESFVSGDAARRLSCDAGVVEIVEDERGTPLSVGRKHRTIAGALKRALYNRDKACTFPGCTHRLFLEGHHFTHWADGGDTSLGNLGLLCSLCRARHKLHYAAYRVMPRTRESSTRKMPACAA